MKAEGYFWFSFGGNSDIGEGHRIGSREKIDFPVEHETGYGAALRNGIEADELAKYKKCSIVVFASNPIVVTAEYPAADKLTYPEDFKLESGKSRIEFLIPNGTVKEVKLFVSGAKNKELEKTDFQILSWELL